MIVDMSTLLRSEVMARSFRVIGTGCYNKVLRCVTRSPAVTNYLNIPPEGSTLQVCTSSILQHWYSNYYYTFHKFHIRKSKVTTIIEATHAYFHWITTSILFRSGVREILYISGGSGGSHRSLYSSTCKPFTCVSQSTALRLFWHFFKFANPPKNVILLIGLPRMHYSGTSLS